MPLFRSKAEKKVIEAGYDPSRLPPGQYFTEKWPVLHAGGVPHTDLATWDLRVFGEVEHELTLSWDELHALPRERERAGHPLRHPLEPLRHALPRRALARAREARRSRRPRARFVVAHAEAGYTANVPISFLEDEQRAPGRRGRRRAARRSSTAGRCGS